MATIESDKVDRALRGKMKAERQDRADWLYILYNEQGEQVSSTRLSKGAKHTLRANRISLMARQLGLDTPQQFVDLVSCSLNREDALRIMATNSPPGKSQQGR